MKKILLSLVLILISIEIASANTNQEKAYTIASVETYPVATVNFAELPTNPSPGTTLDEISIILDDILAIGKKIWPIIEAGRPVINNKLAPSVSIVPHLQNDTGVLYEMENWSIPKAQSFHVAFKNGFGMEVVGFTYTVFFQYNGDLNGIGKYVTSLKVVASDIYVAWGFDFDAASELLSIANVGSSTAPVASGVINITYNVKGKLNEHRSASTIYVDGLGRLQQLN